MAISTDMLAAFLKVAECTSVSAAARELGVGKSVVSKRIAQLESAVQATLFSRSTRHIALTAAGEAYVPHARRALAEVGRAEERLRALRAELSGLIRLTAPVSWGQRVLSRLLPDFLQQHSAIEVELVLADRVMDVAAERLDIALRWSAASPHELVQVPIAAIDWLIVAAPVYLAGAGTPRGPDELPAHSCMAYWRESADSAWTVVRGDERRQVATRSRYHANNPEAVAEATLAGLGLGLLPRYLCDADIAVGRLVPVLTDWTPLTRYGAGITAVIAPERRRFARIDALVAFLQQRLRAPAPDRH